MTTSSETKSLIEHIAKQRVSKELLEALGEYGRARTHFSAGSAPDLDVWQGTLLAVKKYAAQYAEAEVDAAKKEIRALREQVRELEKEARLHRALESAAKSLPEGFEVALDVEKDAGTVSLYFEGERVPFLASGDEDLADCVRAAVKLACAEAGGGNA